MDDDLPPVNLPTPRKRKKRDPSAVVKLKQERDALLERCAIAERAALQNLGYAQEARQAVEDLAEKILTKLDDISRRIH